MGIVHNRIMGVTVGTAQTSATVMALMRGSNFQEILQAALPGQGIESHWGIFSADNSTNIIDDRQLGAKQLSSTKVFPTFMLKKILME